MTLTIRPWIPANPRAFDGDQQFTIRTFILAAVLDPKRGYSLKMREIARNNTSPEISPNLDDNYLEVDL